MPGTNRVRRILMTADTVGGVWTYALDLSRGLAASGVEVNIATMGAPISADQRREANSISGLRLFESEYKLEWMQDPWTDVERAADWLLTLENELNPDVVHLNGYAHGDLPWRAPHLVVGHSCVLSWWRAVKGEAAPPEWTRYRSAVTAGLRASDLVVAPTRAMLTELNRFYGPLNSTAVVPNARMSGCYSAAAKEPFILAAGRVWDEAKNISALARVRRAVDWPIWVAGDRRHPNGESPPLGNVKLLGLLSGDQLAALYARAAVYCLPAKYEPFGLSVLEAALSGCALVLGDIPSLRENWEGAAVFVPPDETYELEFRLRALISSPEYVRSLAARALQRARSFTVEGMCNSYLSLYSDLLEKRPTLAATGD